MDGAGARYYDYTEDAGDCQARIMLQTIPSNYVTLRPLSGTASKQNENLYAACAKFKFPSEANNTNHKVVRGDLISSMC